MIEDDGSNLEIEPEWCEDCSIEAEENGYEYEFNWIVNDGQPYCDKCNGTM